MTQLLKNTETESHAFWNDFLELCATFGFREFSVTWSHFFPRFSSEKNPEAAITPISAMAEEDFYITKNPRAKADILYFGGNYGQVAFEKFLFKKIQQSGQNFRFAFFLSFLPSFFLSFFLRPFLLLLLLLLLTSSSSSSPSSSPPPLFSCLFVRFVCLFV